MSTVIGPRRPGAANAATELWRSRRLIGWFGKRFLEKRYQRTWLGWWWLPLRPTLDVVARAFVFGSILSVPSEGVPYLLFFLIGMSAWNLFEESVYWSARALEINRRVLRRAYVPRLTMLVGSLAIGTIEYLIYLIMAALAVTYYLLADGTTYLDLGTNTLATVAGLALIVLLAQSLGLWLSVLGAQARDVRFGLRYFTGFWFFLTPVIYPLDAVPENLRWLAAINPVTAPVEMVKYGILGTGGVPTGALAVTVGFIVVVATAGIAFFRRSEAAAVDAM